MNQRIILSSNYTTMRDLLHIYKQLLSRLNQRWVPSPFSHFPPSFDSGLGSTRRYSASSIHYSTPEFHPWKSRAMKTSQVPTFTRYVLSFQKPLFSTIQPCSSSQQTPLLPAPNSSFIQNPKSNPTKNSRSGWIQNTKKNFFSKRNKKGKEPQGLGNQQIHTPLLVFPQLSKSLTFNFPHRERSFIILPPPPFHPEAIK